MKEGGGLSVLQPPTCQTFSVRTAFDMTALQVTRTQDPGWARDTAHTFLLSEPILHNLILTLLEARSLSGQEGNYWIVAEQAQVVGVALQSPSGADLNLTPMPTEAVAVLARAIADDRRALPGVSAEAGTAAHFAGLWTEHNDCAAEPYQGIRLYEVDQVQLDGTPNVRLRRAGTEDRNLLIAWMRGFYSDIGENETQAEPTVDARLPKGQFWILEHRDPVSIAAVSLPIAGVVRIQAAYTPPSMRGRGYGRACVGAVSKLIRDSGLRCILLADLANPVSNYIFRRLGYRACAETLRYRFTSLTADSRPREIGV